LQAAMQIGIEGMAICVKMNLLKPATMITMHSRSCKNRIASHIAYAG
jgi:hypothetical protein